MEKETPKPKLQFKPGVGVDVGTANIVVSRQTTDGTFVNKFHRNMLYPMDASDEASELLQRGDYLYVKSGNTYYVVGDDALKLVNAIGRGEVIRPMKDGILNPSLKESVDLLFYILSALVGAPIVENEPLRFTIPANPIDTDADNKFHQMVLLDFFNKKGFKASYVNEAMAICYDTNPIMKSEDGDVPLTGCTISFGAGMSNIALAFKGIEVSAFSITKSGDYIDDRVSKATGLARSKVMVMKEKHLDLATRSNDKILAALQIYYEEMLDRVIFNMCKEFTKRGSEISGKIQIIVAGGSSMAKGFCDLFSTKIKASAFPFEVYEIKPSPTPFLSVAQGACIRAMSDLKKK